MEQREKKPVAGEYLNPMSPRQSLAAWIYLPLHVAVLPLLLSLFLQLWPDSGVTDTGLNLFYYGLGTGYMLLFLWNYFRAGFDAMLDRRRDFALALIMAYGLDLALSWGVQLLFMALGEDMVASPNNEAVMDMASRDRNAMVAMAVFLAPLVEEPLFRGAIFGGLRKRSRALAYAVSAVLFALYHVWQYIIVLGDLSYLLYALSYIPVSLSLALCYERSGSIWCPIFFHMIINGLAMLLLA